MFYIENAYTRNVSQLIKDIKTPSRFTASSPAKISIKRNNSFSILAGPKYSCPGATKACVDCYAMKGNHHMPNVQSALSKNWLAMKKMERNKSSKKAVAMLNDVVPADAKIFRIHESGDFNSQWYLDVWTNVVRLRKDVMFWAYTRSFHLNFQKIVRQKNFTLWASSDAYNKNLAKKFISRYRNSNVKLAYGPVEHDNFTIITDRNNFVCPATNGKMSVGGACEKCRCCFDRKISKNVVFIKH